MLTRSDRRAQDWQAVGMPFPGCEISKRADGGRAFRVFDPVLTSITVGAQVGLQFGAAELIIETPFVLRMSGEHHVLDPVWTITGDSSVLITEIPHP